MICQTSLIPSAAETEFAQLEEKILLHNKAFGDIPEDHRKFVIYYLLEYPKKGMKEVAERSGLSKSLCYDLAKEPELMAMMISAAQVISGLGDLRCSIALDMLAEEMCARIAQGVLKSNDITPTMLRILEAGKTRLGLNPAALSALKVSMTDGKGNRTDVSAIHTNDAEKLLSELRARQEGKPLSAFEADIVEILQPQSLRENKAEICVQNRENGAKSAAVESQFPAIPAAPGTESQAEKPETPTHDTLPS